MFSWIPRQARELPAQPLPVQPMMSAAEATVARKRVATILNCIFAVVAGGGESIR